MMMWLATLALISWMYSVCYGIDKPITDYEKENDEIWTEYGDSWDRAKDGYWLMSVYSKYDYRESGDRKFKFFYGRPQETNTDYSYILPATDLSITTLTEDFNEQCEGDSESIYSITSSSYVNEDRAYTIGCRDLPAQFHFVSDSCEWDYEVHEAEEDFYFRCSNSGVIRGISSDYKQFDPLWDWGISTDYDRIFSFYCCQTIHTPWDLSSTSDSDRMVTEIGSYYNSDALRSTSGSKFGKPLWYSDGDVSTVESTYALTKTNADASFWTRVCPRNGAFASITQNDDNTFSFECAKVIDEVTVYDCFWTENINEFHADSTGGCFEHENDVIRGIQSYYSTPSEDAKFKVYCCNLDRAPYTVNPEINITITTETGTYSEDNAISIDLCWNNALYQGVVVLNAAGTFITDVIIEYGSCGNKRIITVSSHSDLVQISEIGIQENGFDYIMNEFDVYDEYGSSLTASVFDLESNGISITDLIVQFPDDYITTCPDGCTGSVYTTDDYQQYLITLTVCNAWTIVNSHTTDIGVVLRGTHGNLERAILNHPFDELQVGGGNIGDLIEINLEFVDGLDICIEEVTLHDPYNGDQVFGRDHFADGVIFSEDCYPDGNFRVLTDSIQYLPCYDTPLSIMSYDTLLYTSVQIHTCATGGGISADDSDLLSLTVTGMTKSGAFISSDALSLKTQSIWSENLSRDYTLALPSEFDKVSLITLSNNNEQSAFCVDSVLINGEEAFLSYHWVGLTTIHDSLQTIPAILEWPICDIELTTTVSAETPLTVDPDTVATSTCVNRNRFVSVDCGISQTFETYEEVLWQNEVGEEVLAETAIEVGNENIFNVKVGFEAGSAVAKVTGEFEYGHVWSTTTTDTMGTTTIDLTTDGTVNGETITVDCSGSVSVPPAQQIEYSMLIDHSAVTLTTLTDIKMTKCSAFLYGEDYDASDEYVYITGVEGELTVQDATNCYVSFEQAEAVNIDDITCGEERALATREWGTYVPQCDETDSDLYMACQCAFGDSLTLPTCGCVDVMTGILLDTAEASVVAETDTYTWTDWCVEHCGDGSVSAAKAPRQHIKHIERDTVIDKVSKSYPKEESILKTFIGSVNILLFTLIGIGLVMAAGVMTYMVNSCVACYEKCQSASTANKYQSVRLFDTDTEVEKDVI